MGEVFVNYRAKDNPLGAAGIHEMLARRFGGDRVFRDSVSMAAGDQYPQKLRERLERADVLVAVIGPRWNELTDELGVLLIQRDRDWVRWEIARAIERGIPIVPVLLRDTPEDATPPDRAILPASVCKLADYQTFEVSQKRFGADLDRLADRLVELVPRLGAPNQVVSPPHTADSEPGTPAELVDPPDGTDNTVTADMSGVVVQAHTINGDVRIDIGTVNLVTGLPVHTHYQEQVERIAPRRDPGLVGREAELAQLVEFCTAPSPASAYTWWRSEAWSGKTALMSWFVLHPPLGVRIVSFFVTARWHGQNDRAAFIDNVMGQLLTLLDKTLPPLLTESTRETYLLGLLIEAAEACQQRGERLVLLVDGLDEDRGVHEGSDSHSIAALLPARPPAGMRVIVTGRPNPPIPGDVSPHHPLHDNTIIRPLTPSPKAQAIRHEMERDLIRLLRGTVAEQDLLGLVVAAGGGLSAKDLAELTNDMAGRAECSPWEVENRLKTVTGRNFSGRGSTFQPRTDPDMYVYVLGHEELQVTALEMLGSSRLETYRERLHRWAQKYQAKHWPPDTPEYLLRGYFSMLHATDNVARMVVCATDLARRDRMRDLSGGDAAAFAEIVTTQDVIVAQTDPDVIAMMRLAIHRDHLTGQNKDIPPHLPAVWALLGQANRAEAMARSIPDRKGWGLQASSLASVAKATAKAGNLDRAETIAGSITEPFEQAQAVVAVAKAAGETGELDRAAMLIVRAETVARSITHPNQQARTLASVAEAAAKTGDRDQADRLINRAETIARSITDRYSQATALLSVAEATAKARDLDRAEAVAGSITDLERRASALALVAGAAANAGDLDRAEAITDAITDPYWQAKALASVAGAAGNAGDLDRAGRLIDRAEAVADSNTKRELKVWNLVSVAEAAGKAGDRDRAGRLIDRAKTIADSITAHSRLMLDQKAGVLGSVAEAAAKIGDCDRAETIANSITVSKQQACALASMAEIAARGGDLDRARRLNGRAETIVRSIPDPAQQARVVDALASVADAATDAGDLDRAAELITRTKDIASSITDAEDQTRAWTSVAEAVAKTGDLDGAVTIANSNPDPYSQARVLLAVGNVVAATGAFDRAATLIMRAKVIARSFADSLPRSEESRYQQARGLESSAEAAAKTVKLNRAEAAAKAGDFDQAEAALTDSLTTPEEQARVLVSMADAIANSGDRDQATRLIVRAEALAHSLRSTWSRPTTRRVRPGVTEESAARAVALVAKAVATVGDLNRARTWIEHAENIARSITNPYTQSSALVSVVEAVAKAGDLDRAETIADSMDPAITPEDQARAVLAVAATTQDRCRRARAVARTLRIAAWHLPIRQLVEIAPATALGTVIAEFDAVTPCKGR